MTLPFEEKHGSKFHSEKRISHKRTYETQSFELNPDKFDSDSTKAEKLKNFQEALYKAGYIAVIDFRYFIRIFSNQSIIQPIYWKGSPNELYYLVKSLYKENIIIQFKNYWEVACKCFLAHDRNSEVCTPYYLQRCKAPTRGDKLRKLNSVISTLN